MSSESNPTLGPHPALHLSSPVHRGGEAVGVLGWGPWRESALPSPWLSMAVFQAKICERSGFRDAYILKNVIFVELVIWSLIVQFSVWTVSGYMCCHKVFWVNSDVTVVVSIVMPWLRICWMHFIFSRLSVHQSQCLTVCPVRPDFLICDMYRLQKQIVGFNWFWCKVKDDRAINLWPFMIIVNVKPWTLSC